MSKVVIFIYASFLTSIMPLTAMRQKPQISLDPGCILYEGNSIYLPRLIVKALSAPSDYHFSFTRIFRYNAPKVAHETVSFTDTGNVTNIQAQDLQKVFDNQWVYISALATIGDLAGRKEYKHIGGIIVGTNDQTVTTKLNLAALTKDDIKEPQATFELKPHQLQ